jgi:hypothetical protein
MMCQRIGIPPISTIGLGRNEVSSLSRLPSPPARITAFTYEFSFSLACPIINSATCHVAAHLSPTQIAGRDRIASDVQKSGLLRIRLSASIINKIKT